MGSGFSKMKKQARLMQEQFAEMQASLESTLIEGLSAQGLVSVILNGEKKLQKIVIKPECLTDVEALQDLILEAHTDAFEKLKTIEANLQQKKNIPFSFP